MNNKKFHRISFLLTLFLVVMVLSSGCAPNFDELIEKRDAEKLVDIMMNSSETRYSGIAQKALVQLGGEAADPLLRYLGNERLLKEARLGKKQVIKVLDEIYENARENIQQAAINQVINGDGIQGAEKYDPSTDGPHPFIFVMENEWEHAEKFGYWRVFTPDPPSAEWRAYYPEQLQVVIRVLDYPEYMSLDGCSYLGGKYKGRYRSMTEYELFEATTGEKVGTFSIYADPGECPGMTSDFSPMYGHTFTSEVNNKLKDYGLEFGE